MKHKNLLLVYGGGGPEHDISSLSAKFLQKKLTPLPLTVHTIEIDKNKKWVDQKGKEWTLSTDGILRQKGTEHSLPVHFAIPCLHGPPGESGEIQPLFELCNIPYLGADMAGGMACFNKVHTRLWAQSWEIPQPNFIFLQDLSILEQERARNFFIQSKEDVFVKASSQGSSIGIFHVTSIADLEKKLEESFKFSPYVLIEQSAPGRELEMAIYLYNEKLHVSAPGEILCSGDFYDYQEKYSQTSQTKALTTAPNIASSALQQMQDYSIRLFKGFKLRHLARMDFFLTPTGQVLFNECNTFPGHTDISLFPRMMEGNGHDYSEFLSQIIHLELQT